MHSSIGGSKWGWFLFLTERHYRAGTVVLVTNLVSDKRSLPHLHQCHSTVCPCVDVCAG
jgi:hypothetical protein